MYTKISPSNFLARQKNGAIVIDTRSKDNFTEGFIPGSIFLGLEGRLEEWASVLLNPEDTFLLVTDKEKEQESIERLHKAGFTKFDAVLDGGFLAWKNSGYPTDMLINVEPDELAMDIPFDNNLVVVDVRNYQEFNSGHVKNALNVPLMDMKDPAQIANFEDSQNIYLHCASGYRSVVAASILKKEGIHNVRNVVGGWEKIKLEHGIAVEKEAQGLN